MFYSNNKSRIEYGDRGCKSMAQHNPKKRAMDNYTQFRLAFLQKKLLKDLKNIPGRENVKIVCIDLAPGYRSLVKTLFPNARIIADKFHVVKLLTTEIMKERKSQVQDHHRKLLSRGRLLGNGKKLDYWVRSEILQTLKHYNGLRELYLAKEMLHTLYRSKGFLRAYQSHQRLVRFGSSR